MSTYRNLPNPKHENLYSEPSSSKRPSVLEEEESVQQQEQQVMLLSSSDAVLKKRSNNFINPLSNKLISLKEATLDPSGRINMAKTIARIGHGPERIIFASPGDSKPSGIAASGVDDDLMYEEEMKRPDIEAILALAEKTRLALETLVDIKIKAARPKDVKSECGSSSKNSSEPTFIKYTPSENKQIASSSNNERIIALYEAPVDPLEPPKHKHRKIPRGPPSPPAPVLHSPPRKVTVAEQEAWKIPPCISNWKNPKGYTIPLDKRIGADGRTLQEVVINDKFSKLSEALYLADKHAREEVEKRSLLQSKMADVEKSQKEEYLRQLAISAREAAQERATLYGRQDKEDYEDASGEEEEIIEKEYAKRELVRREKEKQRIVELRTSSTSSSGRIKREGSSREVSDKISLGGPRASVPRGGEVAYDQRLFDMSKGINSGFKDDEAYDLYDKPLFSSSNASSNLIYRPRTTEFTHAKEENEGKFASNNDGPVEFEKAEDDPFGLDKFLSDAKKGKEAQQKKGQPGLMSFYAGGSSLRKD